MNRTADFVALLLIAALIVLVCFAVLSLSRKPLLVKMPDFERVSYDSTLNVACYRYRGAFSCLQVKPQ